MNIVDLHCDTIAAIWDKKENLYTNSCHFDIVRARQASISLQIFALFSMPSDRNTALRHTLLLAEKFLAELDNYKDDLYLVKKASDISSPVNNNKIGCLLHLEGAEALGRDVEILHILYHLGLRSLGLTWNHRNLLADGIGEEFAGGISGKGREIIAAMEGLGIMLDLAHISEKAFFEALEYYDQPVLVSHANARTLCPHRRNLTDQQLLALAEHGGIVGINQVCDFVALPTASLDKLIDHIVYIGELIGIDHVSLGSDFDGADNIVLEGVQDYQLLPDRLAQRGFSDQEIQKILGQNALNVITSVIG